MPKREGARLQSAVAYRALRASLRTVTTLVRVSKAARREWNLPDPDLSLPLDVVDRISVIQGQQRMSRAYMEFSIKDCCSVHVELRYSGFVSVT